MIVRPVLLAVLAAAASIPSAEAAIGYPWSPAAGAQTIAQRFAPPAGYRRVAVAPGTYGAWLRDLPLKPAGTPVRLHNGRLKGNQRAHAAVVDIDVGRRDLQQCADAVIRLRAEYLYAAGRMSEIAFRFTSGDEARFSRWAQGWRPRVRGNRVTWERGRPSGTGRASFRAYLRTVFTYAGTISVRRDLWHAGVDDIRIGDVFVQAGSPGHAVLVVDLAENDAGRKVMLLAQSYMPAQDIHVLRNPKGPGAWYPVRFGAGLETPEWTFRAGDLRRFPEARR